MHAVTQLTHLIPLAWFQRAGLLILWILGVSILPPGCSSGPVPTNPQYGRQLEAGERALRKVDPDEVRAQLIEAYGLREDGLSVALERSMTWYKAPSSQSHFPFHTQNDQITHERAKRSVSSLHKILKNSSTASGFAQEVTARFDIYQTVGWDSDGTVLFTGYYAPIFKGSSVQTPEFQHPLHKRPSWLLTSKEGVPFGRRMPSGKLVDSPERTELESSGMLKGTELVWLKSRLDAYICQVNGSACIELQNGRRMHVGYAGKTEHPYTGLGASMLKEKLVPKEGLSLDAIQTFYERDPGTVDRLIDRNKNFVFFCEYEGAGWPAGSLGVPVTTRASIATDKKVYPPGAVALVDTKAVRAGGAKERFIRLVCDQDTGGAIVAPGRCDLFMGIGPEARTLAGAQYFEGTMYYLFLKPDAVTVVQN